MSLLGALASARVADHAEALRFIDHHGLAGRGIGYIDVHLLASAVLSDARLWTYDKRLAAAARGMRLGHAA